MVIGLDVHKKETVGFVVNSELESGEWFTVKTTSEGLQAALPRLEGHKVLIEASTSGKAVARFLANRGIDVDLVQADVLTAHVRSVKNDKIDARDLARIGIIGGYKTCYIPTSEEEEVRCLTRHRKDVRNQATRLKNRIKAILQRNLIPEPTGNLKNEKTRDRYKRLAARALPAQEASALTGHVDRLDRLEHEANECELALCLLIHEHESLEILLTIPGVSTFTAGAVIGFCGDMQRFPAAKKIASYSGLVPRLHQSGEVARGGRITKKGPNVLRFALVEAAHNTVRYPGRLRAKYKRLAPRLGKGSALVAVARTMITMMWSMVRKGRVYDGFDEELAKAKHWRIQTVARLIEQGEVERAKRVLATADVRRLHASFERGTSRLVPAI